MKRLIFLIIVSLLVQTKLLSQSCLPEGIVFTTQEQIDNFQTDNPDCTEIEGDVVIGGWPPTENITNLNGLNVVTSIGGYLHIEHNLALVNLEGLDNLDSIGDWFVCKGNISLINLTGLENLTHIEGGLWFYINSMINLTGLEGLSVINEHIVIPDKLNRNEQYYINRRFFSDCAKQFFKQFDRIGKFDFYWGLPCF